jgi:phosphatidylinositol 3,5-bisphosphate 5-phosphatase
MLASDESAVEYDFLPPASVILEKFFLFEMRDRLCFTASDRLETRWRMLMIERPVQRSATELVMREDSRDLTQEQYQRKLSQMTAVDGVAQTPVQFYGIIGFLHLLNSFYAVLITRRRLVGNIAGHDIHAVDSVRYMCVSHGAQAEEAMKLEERYVKLLSDNDLTRDCYFSHSYDLTRSLQTNMGGRPYAGGEASNAASDMFTWNHRHHPLSRLESGHAATAGKFGGYSSWIAMSIDKRSP